MDERDVDHMIDAGPALDVPRRLSVVSPKLLKEGDLMRVHMLSGEAREAFFAACFAEDLKDRSRPNIIAAADVPNWVDGPPSVRRIVGVVRGTLKQLEIGKRPYWSVNGMHVDTTVEIEKVREFLVRQLQQRVTRAKGVQGVRIVVPTSDTELSVWYMERGFRDGPDFDESGSLIWRPSYRHPY